MAAERADARASDPSIWIWSGDPGERPRNVRIRAALRRALASDALSGDDRAAIAEVASIDVHPRRA